MKMENYNMRTEIINTVLSIIESWKNTNDINSPTLYSDILEELKKLDISEDDLDYLDIVLQGMLTLIRRQNG